MENKTTSYREPLEQRHRNYKHLQSKRHGWPENQEHNFIDPNHENSTKSRWIPGQMTPNIKTHGELEAENKRLREYARHKDECMKDVVKNPGDKMSEWVFDDKCTCGLSALLQKDGE